MERTTACQVKPPIRSVSDRNRSGRIDLSSQRYLATARDLGTGTGTQQPTTADDIS